MPLHALSDMVSDQYQEEWMVGPENTNFYTRTYTAPAGTESKAVLVFIHGLLEHVGRYTQAHPVYAARGIAVFTFDQRGWGRTALDETHRSAASAYGKTSGEAQMHDVAWAVSVAGTRFPGLPVFLMGHSMGGGEVLNFAYRMPEQARVLRGIVGSSPLVQQTKPASGLLRAVGGLASKLAPNARMDAGLDFNDLTHDPEYNKMASKDTLARKFGTLRGLKDLLDWADELWTENYKHWPKTMPLLVCIGVTDPITSHDAAKAFVDKIDADDKTFIGYENGFHELVHEPLIRERLLEDVISWIEHRSAVAPP